MKKLLLILTLPLISFYLSSQTTENPFEKLGYTPLIATLTRGEFEEFHDQEDIVEIGSVLYNTRTKVVMGLLDEGQTIQDVSSATIATSIDPLCEKYYWISPYAYVANNPVKFIDPDGKKIIIVVGNKEYTYNGKGLVSSSGTNMNIPTGSHISKIVNGYNSLRNSGNPKLASMVQHLMNSDNPHYVEGTKGAKNSVAHGTKKTTVPQDEANIKAGIGIGSTTQFNFSDEIKAEFEKIEGVSITDVEIIAHEMQHQFDNDTGNMADSVDKNGANSPAEKRAVNTENEARKLNGSKTRTTYGGEPIEPKKIKK